MGDAHAFFPSAKAPHSPLSLHRRAVPATERQRLRERSKKRVVIAERERKGAEKMTCCENKK
jgi:hypothetical protein